MNRTLLLVISVFALSHAVAKESERKPTAAKEDFQAAKAATPVAKTDRVVVYKFLDEVDGRRMICYFVDGYYAGTSPGGVTCNELK